MNRFYKVKLIIVLSVCFVLTACTDSKKDSQSKPTDSTYIQVDEGSLYYQTFGEGAPIVVVHGGPGLDQSYLLPQMLELAKSHKVIFYDQRGSGKSLDTELNPSVINAKKFVEDLEALRKHLELDKMSVLGHSWGGLLAMHYSVTHPEHVASLILLNSAPADFKGQLAFMEAFAKKTQPINDKIKPLFNYEAFKKLNASEISELYRTLFSVYFYDPVNVNDLTLTMSEASARSGFKVNEVMSKTSWFQPEIDLFPKLKKISIPTLIIHGNDDIVPLWTAQELSEAIAGAKMVALENCGHFPYIEKPVQLFSHIEHFLSEHAD